ncbi:MAG: N-acetylmuramoyl-L-alanine amidase, partial [Clostridia bacterium]|nr:N-acetylmuramoyl-L-alanine amidase [Clostridia bacterium]
ADLMISLHCNSYDEDKSQSGALALVPKIWEGYPSERLSYLSKKAATVLLEEYNKVTGLKNRGIDPIIKSSMFSFCKVPIVLFELGFSTCPSDDKNMNDPVFQDKIVDGMIAGINKYFSLIELAKAEEIIVDTESTVTE